MKVQLTLHILQFTTGRLLSLGLHCLSENKVIPFSPKPKQSQCSDEQSPHTFPVEPIFGNCGCVTPVTLSNIRCVRLSAGVKGRSRSPTQISGLRIEFWDSEAPIFVGQWFQEVAAFPFQPHEKLSGLTLWRSLDDQNCCEGNSSLPIKGIKFHKTGGDSESVEFHLGKKGGMVHCTQKENPYGYLVSALRCIYICQGDF